MISVVKGLLFIMLNLRMHTSFVVKHQLRTPTSKASHLVLNRFAQHRQATNQPSSYTTSNWFPEFSKTMPPKLIKRCSSFDQLLSISRDLTEWRTSLKRGYLPEDPVWPYDPLLSELIASFSKYKVPQLVNKHKELLEPLVSTIIDLGLKYNEESGDNDMMMAGGPVIVGMVDGKDGKDCDAGSPEDKKKDDIAKSIMKGFDKNWGPALEGIASLDALLGPNHDAVSRLGLGDGSEEGKGAGHEDGLWKRSGWKKMNELQQRLSDMSELKDLIDTLGRRPSASGRYKTRHSNMRENPSGPIGVAKNPLLAAELEGLHFSGDINKVTFRDTMLLKGSPVLRKLFLSRYTGRTLLTYQYTDWTDQESIYTKSERKVRLPTAAGGPIIVCIDTSGSMGGSRETLAKAVVLECVSVAHRAKRDCYVLAFSGRGDISECDMKMSVDKGGLDTLLNFLEYSFSGGTDVVAPLNRALELMNKDDWVGADILMVTDGELCDPPLNKETSELLKEMSRTKYLRIHGLLVGNSESKPLSSICENDEGEDRVHDFLNDYDGLAGATARRKAKANGLSRL